MQLLPGQLPDQVVSEPLDRMTDQARWEADAHGVLDETIRRLVLAGYNRGRQECAAEVRAMYDLHDRDPSACRCGAFLVLADRWAGPASPVQ